MSLHFTFSRRIAALICLLMIVLAVVIVSLHHARSAQAQNSSTQLDQIQDELQQLDGEINIFLEQRSRTITSTQNALSIHSGKRLLLLLRLSALENEVRNVKSTSEQSKNLMNTIRELEEKIFNSATPAAKPATVSLVSRARSQIRKSGDSSQTKSTQIHPDATGT